MQLVFLIESPERSILARSGSVFVELDIWVCMLLCSLCEVILNENYLASGFITLHPYQANNSNKLKSPFHNLYLVFSTRFFLP